MSYTVTLSNGKAFTDLAVSGSCFVSEQPVLEEDFTGGLRRVVLSGAAGDEEQPAPFENGEHFGLRLACVFQTDGKYYFALNQLSEEQLAREQSRADIDYLALMTGVEL